MIILTRPGIAEKVTQMERKKERTRTGFAHPRGDEKNRRTYGGKAGICVNQQINFMKETPGC